MEHTVASVEDVPPGEGIGVEVEGLEVAVFNVDGEFYATQNRCAHKGGPLYRSAVDEEGCSISCPWHHISFDLEEGRSAVNPDLGLRLFDVRVEGSDVVVEV